MNEQNPVVRFARQHEKRRSSPRSTPGGFALIEPFDVAPLPAVRKGFTLIELLVVISIIALLIAILLPALRAAREASKAVTCLSNIRQVGIASITYSIDYDEYWMPYKRPWTPSNVEYWAGILVAKGGQLADGVHFDCPSYEPTRELHLEASRTNSFDNNWFYVQYGYNWRNIGTRFNELGSAGFLFKTQMKTTGGGRGGGVVTAQVPFTPRQAQIANPSETIVMVDAYGEAWGDPLTDPNSAGICFVGDRLPNPTGAPDARHQGTVVNVMWADGHGSGVKAPSRKVETASRANPDAKAGAYDPSALGQNSETKNTLWDIQ